jgi:hypothetical protein
MVVNSFRIRNHSQPIRYFVYGFAKKNPVLGNEYIQYHKTKKKESAPTDQDALYLIFCFLASYAHSNVLDTRRKRFRFQYFDN